MNRQYKKYLQVLTIIMDFSMLNISFISSLLLFEVSIYENVMATHQFFWLIVNVSWIFLSFTCGNYGDKIINDFESFAKRTVQVYILWMITILVYLVFTKDYNLSRLFILFLILNFGIGLSLNRFLYFGVKNYLKIQHDYVNKVIILGFNETAKKLASYLEEEGVNIKLLGFTEDEKNMKELSNYPILASIGNTIKIAKELDAQEIFSTITPEQNKNIYQLMREAEKKCLRFKVLPNLSVFFRRPVVIDYIRDLPVLSLRNDPLEDVGNRLKKRFLDIIISSFVIVFILSWMIPILGLIILIESK
jgi:putative colanic acid biosynthesis UDP-glucose lipid carrier transferase